MVLVVPEQSQRPYRFGMTLLCVGALFNWLGLADTYSDPVPAIRYIGVGLIAAGASLICMAMCFWMRNIHDPNLSDFEVSSDPVHVIAVDPSLEKPPDYSSVVDVPPCYEDAIKLHSATVAVHTLKHVTTSNNQCTGTMIEASGKITTANLERNNSLQSGQSCDIPDFSTAAGERRHSEKSEQEASQNSSQGGNALAKVLRKSIRGIRRLRSSSEDSNQSNEPSCMENGTIERVFAESTSKSDR